MALWILLLSLCSCFYQSSAFCNTTQYEKNDICCSLCKPGQSLKKECTESSDTECVDCAEGEYQETWNRETSCLLHHDCDERFGFRKISEGTRVRKVDCTCAEGRHCSSAFCETCVWNTECAPGYGVTQRASRYVDTHCAPCPKGTFSNITSDTQPCRKWSICDETQQEVRQGNSTNDVTCGTRSADNTWVYVLVILIVLVVLALVSGAIIFVNLKKKKENQEENQEETLPKVGQPLCLIPKKEDNLPEEDQDITMQGYPLAQEQGKDYRMPQEEVREHLLNEEGLDQAFPRHNINDLS